ncbi:hypothetical protein [Streptomyces sp. NPDC097619]|uniref:hypothetical protein n=1 Tax=Streptomyces sp. NPDC097619 TaxID=3157228 RepID=UPI00331EF933
MSEGNGIVWESVRFRVPCQGCAGTAEAVGGQGLVFGRLEWSEEIRCGGCGRRTVTCGRGETPSWLRERLLAEGELSPARLVLTGEGGSGRSVVAMKVFRARLGLDLAGARALLAEIESGHHEATLPEAAELAEALRAVGVAAHAVPRGQTDCPISGCIS